VRRGVSDAVPESGGPASQAALAAAVQATAPLKTMARDEKAAWRELAPMWGVNVADGDPCAAAARQAVRCSKFFSTLPTVRSLGRPGFMNVRDETGRVGTVLLTGLGENTAVLQADGKTITVPLATLAKAWQGEFGTLWRLPEGYVTAVADGASGPLVDRLAAQLASVAGEPAPVGRQTMDAGLRAKVARFQSAHGLSPVGKAGPTTFMQLNRRAGVVEPQLRDAGAVQ
jgi:general secretion pathway protein A